MIKKIILILIVVSTTKISSQNWTSGGISANSIQGGVYDIEFHNNILFASVNNDGLIKSTDNGKTWEKVNITEFETNPNSRSIQHIISAENNLYVVTFFAGTSSSMIYKSIDNGKSFTKDIEDFPKAPNDETRVMNITDLYYENGQLIAIISGGDYTKSNDESKWKAIDDTVKFSEHFDSYNNIMYAFPSYGIKKSTDNGKTWVSPANTNLPQLFLPNNLTVDAKTGRIYVSGKSLTEQIHKLLYSDDEGETWVSAEVEKYLNKNWIGLPQTITEIFSYGDLVQLALENDNRNSGPEILISTDGSKTFSDDKTGILDLGLGTTEITKFILHSDYLFAAVNYGQVYYKNISTLSISPSVLNSVKLYPNPSDDFINIFTRKKINWSIFNITGNQLKFGVISETNNKISIKNLSAGMYFINLNSGTLKKTIKFVKK